MNRLGWVRVFIAVFICFSSFSLAIADESLSLTWEACLREASENNPDLIAAYEEVIQSQTAKMIVRSDHLPRISTDVSATTTHSDQSGVGKSFSYSLSATQLLFDGLQTPNLIKAASEDVKASRANYKFISADIRFNLREAFVNLLKAQELLKLTEEIYKIRKDNLDLIKLRYESGTEHRGALLTAEANVTQAEFEVNQAKRGIETAQRRLIKELGRKQFSFVMVEGKFKVKDDSKLKPDFEILVKENPQVLRMIAQKNAATFNLKADQGALWPNVSLSADVGRSDGHWPPDDEESSAKARVSLPLFQGGERVARIKQSKSILKQKEQEQRSVNDEVVADLQEAWAQLQDAIETVKVQEDFLKAAQERAKISAQQYSIGMISFDNWTIIEDDLVRNKKVFLNAQANALLAEASWVKVKGETFEYEIQ